MSQINVDTKKKKVIEIYSDCSYEFDKLYKFTLEKISNGETTWKAHIEGLDPQDPFYFKLTEAIINHFKKNPI